MRYLLQLSVCLVVWASVGCSISHQIEETEPPPDQPPLMRLEESTHRETEGSDHSPVGQAR